MEADLNQIVIGVLVSLVLVLVRKLRKTQFWQRIEKRATDIIADPSMPIEDPREAVERALVEAQRAQLDTVERSIRSGGNGNGMKPNGH